jgi:7,8-dihydropterin-6-yl-methyl-4-(beta-D-ribofuranosyl)aminobenzene 5'-phosphate synthase
LERSAPPDPSGAESATTEIVVLAENRASRDPQLRSEHGLSLLVISHGRRVLFDTGASSAAVENADRLGLGDVLGQIDAIVVSHGHYDHAGGLAAVLERTRRPTPVHIRSGFFRPRLSTRTGQPRSIGVPFDRAALEARGGRFVEEAGPRQILRGFWLTGEIPLRAETGSSGSHYFVGASPPDDLLPDAFADEHALAVETPRGLAVLVGCAHRGIINSILAATSAAARSAHSVFGGAHLRGADADRIRWSVERATSLVREAALGHCTGEPALSSFARIFGDRFHPLQVGWTWRG